MNRPPGRSDAGDVRERLLEDRLVDDVVHDVEGRDDVEGAVLERRVGRADVGLEERVLRKAGGEPLGDDRRDVDARDAAHAELVPEVDVEARPGPDLEDVRVREVDAELRHALQEDLPPHAVDPAVVALPERREPDAQEGVVGAQAVLPVALGVEGCSSSSP